MFNIFRFYFRSRGLGEHITWRKALLTMVVVRMYAGTGELQSV